MLSGLCCQDRTSIKHLNTVWSGPSGRHHFAISILLILLETSFLQCWSTIQSCVFLPLTWVIGTIQHDYQDSFAFTNYYFIAFMVKRIYPDGNNGKGWKLIVNLGVSSFRVSIENSSELRTSKTLITYHEKTHNCLLALILTSWQSFPPWLRKGGGTNFYVNSKSSFPYGSDVKGKKIGEENNKKHRW